MMFLDVFNEKKTNTEISNRTVFLANEHRNDQKKGCKRLSYLFLQIECKRSRKKDCVH